MENRIPEPSKITLTTPGPSFQPTSASHDPQPKPGLEPVRARSKRPYWILALLIAGAALTVFGLRAHPRTLNEGRGLLPESLSVPVASVTREDVYNEVTIPAEFRPFLQVELHAKVSGYVTNITVDFGDKVKAGQLLAELEVPELRDEVDRGKAALQKAQADHKDANLAYTRLLAVEKQHPNLVAQQELDTADAKDRTTDAAVAAAQADLEKYLTMASYTRIIAPFDGIVTHRYADPGALIQAGTASNTQSLPLVRISNNYRLRLDFPVSVLYVRDIKLGDPVEVRVDSSKSFTGTISRFTHKVDEDTRTMITEIEVPNPDLELTPGMYANVVLKVGRHSQALTIPTEAVSADRKASVYVVNSRNEVEERPLTLGLETPTRYEVLNGLKAGEFVVTGSHAQIKPGQKVIAKLSETYARQ